MNVNVDHIINEASLMAYKNTNTSQPSGRYISIKRLVNHYNERFSVTRGEISF